MNTDGKDTSDWVQFPDGGRVSVLKDSIEGMRLMRLWEANKDDPRFKQPATVGFNGQRYP